MPDQHHLIRIQVIQHHGQIAKLGERRRRGRRSAEPASVVPDDAVMRRQPVQDRQPDRGIAPPRMQQNQNRAIAACIVGP